MIDSEFKGVCKHCGSPCHTMDQWSTQLVMCSNWLPVLPREDNFRDVLDHDHKNRTLESCRNIITLYQASNQKLRKATPLFQYTMTFTYPKAKEPMRPHTSVRQLRTRSVYTRGHANMHKNRRIHAACWLVIVTFEMVIVLTRKADSVTKKRVRVCTQKLMLAFHCIVSCKGDSTVFHGNWLLPIPLAFTQRQRILRVKVTLMSSRLR